MSYWSTVFEILLKVSNGQPWPESLSNAVPQRFYSNLVPNKKNEDISETVNSETVNSSDEDADESEQQSTFHNEHCLADDDLATVSSSKESSNVTNSTDEHT